MKTSMQKFIVRSHARFVSIISLALGACLVWGGSARAADWTWDADPATPGLQDGGGFWSLLTNSWWNGAANVPWSATATNNALFGNGSGAAGPVTVGTNVVVSNITFNAAGSGNYVIGGNTLTLAGTPVITANADATINSSLAGGGVIKAGASTLNVAGPGTYTGATVVTNGTLRLQPPVVFTNSVSVPAAALWLDASDAATVQTNASGQVTLWVNKGSSGAAGNASPPAEGNAPSIVAGALNGLPVVRFNGTSSVLTNIHVNATTQCTFMGVLRRSSVINQNAGPMSFIQAGTQDFASTANWLIYEGGTGSPNIQFFRGASLSTYAPHPGNGNPYVLTALADGAKGIVFVNGAAQGAGTASTLAFNIQRACFGNRFSVAGGGLGADWWAGDFAELLVFNRALTTDERLAVEAYLQNKWFSAPPTGLALWLDAADASTLFKDGAGTQPVTASGDVVTRWNDKSGKGNHALVSGTETGPTYQMGAQNGRAAVRFSAVTTCGMTTTMTNSSDMDIFLVYNHRSTASTARRTLQGQGNWLIGPYNNQFQVYCGGFIPGPAVTPNQCVIHEVQEVGATVASYVNGSLAGTRPGSAYPGKIYLGAPAAVANPPYAEVPDGDIVEVLIFSRPLSTDERQMVTAYLRGKWFGVLPATTPLAVAATATFDLNAVNQTVGSISGAGMITNNSPTAALLTMNSAATNSFSGPIGGSLSFTKSGSGLQTFDGSAANTYTGTTLVDNGTLTLAKSGGVPAIAGPVQMGAGNINQPNFRMGANYQFDPNAVMTFANASGNWTRFDLQNTTQSLAGIQCTTGGGIIQNERLGGGGTVGPATLIISNTADYSFTGYFRDRDGGDGTYPIGLIKNGPGLQELSGGQIRYTGPTLINNGTLRFTAGVINTNVVTVNTGATLWLTNATTFPAPVALQAGATSLVTTVNGAVDNWNYAKALTGTGTLVKDGTGWFQLRQVAPRDFQGSILIKQGRLGSGMNDADWSNSKADVTVWSGASLDVRTDDMTIDELWGDGEVVNTYKVEAFNTLKLGANNGSSSFNGVIRGKGDGVNNTSPEAGATAINKAGTGTLTLNGQNTYGGSTLVSGGTLVLGPNASISNSAVISVATNALFDVSGVTGGFNLNSNQALAGGDGGIKGNVTALVGSILAPGGFALPGIINLSNSLTLSDANLTFDLAANNTPGSGINDLVQMNGGTLTLNGTNKVSVNWLGDLPSAASTLIQGAGSIVGGPTNFAFATAVRPTMSINFDTTTTPGSVLMSVSGSGASLTWRAPTNNNWDFTTTNWDNAGVPDIFWNFDQPVFNDTASNTTVNLVGTLYPKAVSINNSSSNYIFQGGGKISGGATLAKSGPGLLTINQANDYLGVTTITDGVVTMGNVAALGATNGGTVVSGTGTLDLNTLLVPGERVTISGQGFNGQGALVNNTSNNPGANSFGLKYFTLAGNATVGGLGRWDVQNSPGNVVGNNFTLTKVGTNTIDFGYDGDTGFGDIILNDGIMFFEGLVSMGNPTNVCTINSNAVLAFWDIRTNVDKVLVLNGGSVSNGWGNTVLLGKVTLNTNAPFNIGGVSLTASNTIDGPGTLSKGAAGTLYLAASNTYTGNTIVTNGTLSLGNGNSAGSVPGTISVTNATLAFNRSDSYDFANAIVGGGISGSNYTVNVIGGGTLNLTGGTLDGGILRIGTGTNGSVAQSGGSLVAPGSISIAYGATGSNNPSSYSLSGTGVASAPGLVAGFGNNSNCTAIANISGGNLALTGTGADDGIEIARWRTGAENNAWGQFNLSGSGTVSTYQVAFGFSGADLTSGGRGEFNMTGGTLVLGAGGLKRFGSFVSPYSVSLSGGTIVANADFNCSLSLTLGGSPGVTIQAADTNGGPHTVTLTGAISGPSGLTKTGAGTLDISGVGKTYAGPTIVNEGVLRITTPPTAPPITDSVLWLDAADAGTVQLDFNGTVTNWVNKGSAGPLGDSMPPALANAPAYTNTLNGRPVLTVHGTQYLLNSITNATDKITVFAMIKRTSVPMLYPGPMSFCALGQPDHNNPLSIAVYDDANGENLKVNRNSANISTFVPHPGNNVPFLCGLMFDGARAYTYINGVQGTFAGASTGNFDIQRMSIGLRLDGPGGTPNYNSGSWAGDIAEILVFNRALSFEERQVVQSYLDFKWLNVGAGSDILPTTAPVSLAANGTLDLNGLNQSIGSLSGSGLVTNSVLTTATLTVGLDNSNTVFSGVIGGPVALAKAGTGSLTLPGVQTYTFDTTINNGALVVDGEIGTSSGTVTVVGGQLRGTGTVQDWVSVTGGTVAPGSALAMGTLTVNNGVALAGNAAFRINKSGVTLTSDLLKLQGESSAIYYGGTLTVTASGDTLALGDTFKLFDAPYYDPGYFFTTFNLPALGAGLGWDVSNLTVDGTITVAELPVLVSFTPDNQTVECTGTATFTVSATGALGYEWYFNGTTLIPDATGATLTLNNVAMAQSGSYTVRVINNAGYVTAGPGVLTVQDTIAPLITCPGNITNYAPAGGQAVVNFTPSASDACQLASVTCVPAGGSSFGIGTTPVTCTALDGVGNRSQCSFDVVVEAWLVVTGKVAMEYYTGLARDGAGAREVTFAATKVAGGVTNLLATWTNSLTFAAGADGYGEVSFTLTNVPPSATRLSAKTAWSLRKAVDVTITGGAGEANFTGASKLPGGDFDGSNLVDIEDYFALAAVWYQNIPAKDIDGSGLVDADDYFILASHWYQQGDPE